MLLIEWLGARLQCCSFGNDQFTLDEGELHSEQFYPIEED